MIFADLPNGASIFLDANTFVYYFAPDPSFGPACGQLLQRVENQEIRGFTSTHILTEAAHRLMTVEATTVFGWPFPGIAVRLRKHPAEVSKLVAFRQAIDAILKSRVEVLTIDPALTLAGATVSQQFGLLSNDAMLVAVMQANGLTNLGSNDTDFDCIPGISRYAPV